jgi:uncharacterized protein DUF3224
VNLLVALFFMMISVAPLAHAQTNPVMPNHARGTFDVKVTPQPADGSAGGPFGRLVLDKQFHGSLEATSKGTMLGTGTAVEGSGAYVAFELVTGTLDGKHGTFILQHVGTMQRNVPTMTVTVVPDSGTDQLIGLTGRMTIIIEGGKHSYDLEYFLGGGAA